MKSRRFFATVWRINAIAILLTVILTCCVLLFATWQIYKEATRTRHVSNVVNVADEQLDRSRVQLGTFESIAGSTVLRAPLRLEQEYGFSAGSKETKSVQNYLFYPSSARAYWLVPGYRGLFLATYELPARQYTPSERPVVAVVYELVDSDSTGDRRLTASDAKIVAVSNPSGLSSFCLSLGEGVSRELAYQGAAMKGQGKVKGILVEGNDGHEYLLGFGPDHSPIFSRRQADGTFEPLDDVWRASKVAITQIGHTGGLIGPGMGNNTWLWGAFRAALEAFPPIPTWPTLSS